MRMSESFLNALTQQKASLLTKSNPFVSDQLHITGGALPKAAYAKKDLMAATAKNTNAYGVYLTAFAARVINTTDGIGMLLLHPSQFLDPLQWFPALKSGTYK